MKNLLKISINLSLSVRKFFHSHFDSKLISFIEINSLKTVINNRTEKLFLDFDRLKGALMRLRFYDSHRFQIDLKYRESELPTVLVLPSGEFKIEDYNYLIGNLVESDFRVLAIEFPGKLHFYVSYLADLARFSGIIIFFV